MTNFDARNILRRLGRGEAIDRVCAEAKLTRPQFDAAERYLRKSYSRNL